MYPFHKDKLTLHMSPNNVKDACHIFANEDCFVALPPWGCLAVQAALNDLSPLNDLCLRPA